MSWWSERWWLHCLHVTSRVDSGMIVKIPCVHGHGASSMPTLTTAVQLPAPIMRECGWHLISLQVIEVERFGWEKSTLAIFRPIYRDSVGSAESASENLESFIKYSVICIETTFTTKWIMAVTHYDIMPSAPAACSSGGQPVNDVSEPHLRAHLSIIDIWSILTHKYATKSS